MYNILYDPPPYQRKKALSLKGEELFFSEDITHLSVKNDLLFFSKRNSFKARTIKGEKKASINIGKALKLYENQALAFQTHPRRYALHSLIEERGYWKQKTTILLGENTPDVPVVSHLTSRVIYILDKKNNLYQNRTPSTGDKYSPWEKIETGLRDIHAASGQDGLLLWQGENALLVDDGNWRKFEKTFPEEIVDFAVSSKMYYLDENSDLRDESGQVFLSGVLDITSNSKTVIALLRDEMVIKSDAGITRKRNMGYDKIFLFQGRPLLLEKASGQALLLSKEIS